MALVMWYVLISVISIFAIIGTIDMIKDTIKTNKWLKERGLK